MQTDGDHPSHLHDRALIHINGDICHLFDLHGESIPKARRHHLMNESHEQQYQQRLSNQAE